MKNSLKTIALIALVLTTILMTSCNRGGYGCPYELKAPKLSLVKK